MLLKFSGLVFRRLLPTFKVSLFQYTQKERADMPAVIFIQMYVVA